ncbi:MAG TPA: YbfB/YjiJ family MFS transporter [Burkholderiales bacterium]
MGIALAGLATLAVAMGIGRFAFTPLLPMMQADAGLTLAQGGWLASANYAGYLAGALSASRAPLGIRSSLAAIAVTTFAMALWPRLEFWIALRFLAGVASAWVLVQVSAWSLGRLAELGRPQLAGVVFAGVGAGIAIAGLLCLALMSLHATSGHAWMALGAASLIATVLLWPAFSPAGSARAPAGQGGWNPQWGWLVAAYGAYGFGYIIPATFLPAMARDLVADPALFGWAWPVFGLAAAASTTVLVRLPIGARTLWLAAHLTLAAGVAMPVAVAGLSGILLSALLVGGTFTVITLAAMRDAQTIAGAQATRLMAALTAAFAAGQIAGPVFISLLAQANWSFDRGLLIASAVLALSAGALTIGSPKT